MTTSTDERRALAMQQAIRLQLTLLHLPEHQAVRIDSIVNNLSSLCAMSARTSDEAVGMVLVPREATEEMYKAGYEATKPILHGVSDIYRAMIAAATEADNG